MKLFVHFITDLYQPLHNQGYKHGGTNIHIQRQSYDKALPAAWNASSPETIAKHLHKRGDDVAMEWVNDLVDEDSDGKSANENK